MDQFMQDILDLATEGAEQSNAESRCYICGKAYSELEPFDWPGPFHDFVGVKLAKSYREELPAYVGSSWECRDCIVRDGGLWDIYEEDRLGRPLSDYEKRLGRYELWLSWWMDGLTRNLSLSERAELLAELDDWTPAGWQSK